MFHNSNLCSLIATIQCFPSGAFFTRFVYLRLSDPAALIRPASQRSPCGLTWPAFGLDHIRTTIRNSCNTPSPSVIERRSNPFFIPSFGAQFCPDNHGPQVPPIFHKFSSLLDPNYPSGSEHVPSPHHLNILESLCQVPKSRPNLIGTSHILYHHHLFLPPLTLTETNVDPNKLERHLPPHRN